MNHLYTSWHSSPAAIASAAWLYHFQCADLSHAAVLEIGCGRGENLIRHALCWPESTCVGIDIDAQRIAIAEQQRDKMALSNLHLYCLGVSDLLSVEVGKFDFIIIPSLYAQLDNSARSALLNWCQRQLSEQGVIAVRWHTLPGGSIPGRLRQAIAWQCRAAQDEQAWLVSARAMLSLLEISDVDPAMQCAAAAASGLTDAELLAQFLDDIPDACLVSDFARLVAAEQLRLTGDVVPQYEIAAYYGEKVALLQQAVMPANDALQARQYLDFAVQRRERYSLLTARDSRQAIGDFPDMTQLASMHWAASCVPTGDENQRITRYGERVDCRLPAVREVLDWLSAAWPRSLSTQQLIRLTHRAELPEQQAESTMAGLQHLFLNPQPSLYLTAGPSSYNCDRAESLRLLCDFDEREAASADLCARDNGWGQRLAFKRQEYQLWQRELKIDSVQDARLAVELAGKGLLSGSAASWEHFWQAIFACGDRLLIEGGLRAYLLAVSPDRNGATLSAGGDRTPHREITRSVSAKKARRAEVLLNAGHYAQAKEAISALLADHPRDGTLLLLAVAASYRSSDFITALALIARRLSLGGNCLPLLEQMGDIFAQMDAKSPHAALLFQHLLKQDINNSQLWLKVSGGYSAHRAFVREEHCLQTALRLKADNVIALLRLATLYSHSGRMDEAKALCLRALKGEMDALTRLNAWALYLFILSHDAALPAQDKFRAHCEFGKLASQWAHSLPPVVSAPLSQRSRTTIRIGFVSGDFNAHPVHHFIWPVWQSIQRDRYELFAYATGKTDAVTADYRASATVFREVTALSQYELARQIADDGIDVLIDLAGFTNGNRLLSFALKPAPVQMSWIGFVGSTGLPQMDYYIINDGLAKPGELDAIFSEKLVSLPSAKLFEYSALAPEIGPLPALKNGYLTLGSFNRPQKITPAILDCWAQILRALPDARLLFGFMTDERMCDDYRAQMVRRGVQPQQLTFRLKLSLQDYLALHNEVDILLDSHPYSAGTTAQHALWMGVPLITAIEASAVSRTSALALKTLNLAEFVSENLQEYAQKVIALNSRYSHLSALRQSLRTRIAQRERAHSHNAYYFEKMIDAVWQRCLDGQPPEALFIADEHRWELPDEQQ